MWFMKGVSERSSAVFDSECKNNNGFLKINQIETKGALQYGAIYHNSLMNRKIKALTS